MTSMKSAVDSAATTAEQMIDKFADASVSDALKAVATSSFVALAKAEAALKRADAVEAALRKELSDLRAEQPMSFLGPHLGGKDYRAGSVVQRSSATWIALVDNSELPGASVAWRRIASNN